MNSKNDATLGRIRLAPKKILEIYRFVNVNVKFGYELRDLEYPFGVYGSDPKWSKLTAACTVVFAGSEISTIKI